MVATGLVLIYCHYVRSRHQSKHSRLMHYGLISSITGGGSKKDDGEKKKEDVLNIFSVASGHLYERFLRWVAFSSQTHTATRRLSRSYTLHPFFFSPDPETHLSIFLSGFQNNDAVCPPAYQNTCQVLVPQELPLPVVQGTSLTSPLQTSISLLAAVSKNNVITPLQSFTYLK